MEDSEVVVLPDEAQLDSLSQEDLDQRRDQTTMRKVELLQDFANGSDDGKTRKITLRFLVSPTMIYSNNDGQVAGIRLVKNELTQTEAGTLRPNQTDQIEEIPVGLVFHSIGYRGLPLPGVPFNESWGVITNKEGRIFDPAKDIPISGLYTAGWIKRGPSGVIGTNKLDASETVKYMLEDFENGNLLDPEYPESSSATDMIRQRQPEYILFDEWLHLDQIEVERGKEKNRPRVKFTEINSMLSEVDY
jgi:ferredoxin--NADP+ reductase